MMEEVSIAAAYDAHIINQTTEEDLLASLVAHSKLRAAQLPNQKQREMKRKVPFQRENQPPMSIEMYKRENQLLQKSSIRLEQENDILAHELLNSKVVLRRHLDQVEDKAEQLNQELLEARLQLLDSTEEMQVQEEATTKLKEVFRAQLEEAESQRETSNAIMAEYKQICSQLSSRLETEEGQAKAELDRVKSLVGDCEHCQVVFDEVGQLRPPSEGRGSNPGLKTGALQSRQKDLEQELAQVKIQLVEAECRIQDLEHQKGALESEFQNTRNWFTKALSNLKIPPVHH
ncbi:rab GTPase-activating protein 1-like isoform X1 [Anguilla rostrata]|uniref:rab GTPase-activating protein 1-like isoform X1 n=1 Tax=Anguilla anguilla TaxID=7936 RepID=UPI0015AAAC7A|nr:rab GTPase-activating protein 1-like isoform X1 [Anguilla anguilla]